MKHRDIPAKPCWFIVNMCNRWGEERIERSQKPTVLHASLASAYAEAARLADTHSKGDYAIFECIGRVKSSKRVSTAEPAPRRAICVPTV